MEGKMMFYKSLEDANIFLNERQKERFEIYKDLLIEWNQKMNLTAIESEDDIYIRHFLDSVSLGIDISVKGKMCDVGSGAGFPSIPLKIVFEELHVWIVEPLQKRCTFLNEVVKQLDLKDVTIENERAEDYAKTHREFFDVVSARAVANLTMLSELCIPLVKKDGIFVAMKGPKAYEEYEEAKFAITTLGCKKEQFIESKIGEFTRVTMVFHKVKETMKKYPRAFGQIKNRPLKG